MSPRLLVEMCVWLQKAIPAKTSISSKVPVVLNVAADSNQYLTYTLKGGKKAFQYKCFLLFTLKAPY